MLENNSYIALKFDADNNNNNKLHLKGIYIKYGAWLHGQNFP